MKKVIFSCSILSFFIALNANNYHQEAQEWVLALENSLTEHDAHLLLNLIYWSYQRSATTLTAQRAFIADQTKTLEAHSALINTRLNPSIPVSVLKSHDLITSREKFIKEFVNQQLSGKIYAHCVEELVHGSKIQSSVIKKHITTMRDNARAAIAQALLKKITELQETFCTIQCGMTTLAELFQQQSFFGKKSTKFLHYLWDYLPQVLIKSFVAFDKQYTELNNQCWQAVIKSEEFCNILWEVIEVERAQLYKEYYRALYNSLQKYNYTRDTYLLLYDNQKNLELSNYLPKPEELVL